MAAEVAVKRHHRPLVFLDDATEQERWGFWCLDCPVLKDGYKSDLRPSRLARRHIRDTHVPLQEAC